LWFREEFTSRRPVQVAGAAERLLRFDSPRKLVGYWLQIHIASLVMRPAPTPVTRFSSLHIAKESLSRKEAKALKGFYRAFEAVSSVDERAGPPQQFTPRTSVTIPAGSTFFVHEDRILQLSQRTHLSEDDQASLVASLTVGEEDYGFTFFELMTLPPDAFEEWRCARAQDRPRAHLALVAQLYKQRLPYEEPQ
jgi:hypothetical protein